MNFPLLFLSVVLSSALLITGCGGSEQLLPRHPITVTVTYEGKPVDGMISIIPDVEAKVKGGGTGGYLQEGKFSSPQQRGVFACNHLVMITVFDPAKKVDFAALQKPGAEGEADPAEPEAVGYAKKMIEMKAGDNNVEIKLTADDVSKTES